MEFDGLFGFETIATRLLKRFGKSQMLDAFNKRTGDTPNSGKETQNVEIAKKFVDNFEISSIETVANSKGISFDRQKNLIDSGSISVGMNCNNLSKILGRSNDWSWLVLGNKAGKHGHYVVLDVFSNKENKIYLDENLSLIHI